MYFEKEYLLESINEYCIDRNIELSFGERYELSSRVSKKIDEKRIIDFDSFIELLDHNEQLEQYNNIDFDDEIVSVEYIGEMEMVDFNVSGNRLFYANGILTHNSVTNEVHNVDNSNVSDSLGSAMTADFMMFLLQNEEMKENGEIVCKVTKNRFNGRTDTWMMNVDYNHMRFSDMVVQNHGDIDLDISSVITPEKQSLAEDFADNEVKDIQREDMEKIKKDPFTDNIDDIYKELGI